MKTKAHLTIYQSAAKVAFENLKPLLLGSTNYWQAGNVFDTVTDYFLQALNQGLITPAEVAQVMQSVMTSYSIPAYSYNGNSGDWYDDFGWWGIASAKAYLPAYQPVFGSTAPFFQNVANACWALMTNGKSGIDGGAPNVWANCDKTYFSGVAPYFPGGVWQYDINYNYSPLTTYGNYVELGPYQNTVVNGLYFVLTSRLYSTNPAVANLYSFLTNWCFNVAILPANGLLYSVGPNAALVMERVAIYQNGTPVNPTDWRQQNTCWAGDQGLILGGMVDYLSTHPGDAYATQLLPFILSGVSAGLSNAGILQPWYPWNGVINPLQAIDTSDYSSGIGVFMRYLLYAFNNNAVLKQRILAGDYGITDLLFQSAYAAAYGGFPTYGNKTLFDYFNQLSTLTTAIAIFSD